MSANPDYVGQTCRVIVPYTTELVERSAVDVDQLIAGRAAEALQHTCAGQGLKANGQHLVWSGTVRDCRETEHAQWLDALPDDFLVQVHEAVAVAE